MRHLALAASLLFFLGACTADLTLQSDEVGAEAQRLTALPVLGPSHPSLTSLMRVATVTASSSYGAGWEAAKAVDGVVSYESKWVSNGSDFPNAWLQLDFGSKRTIDEVVLHLTSSIEGRGWSYGYRLATADSPNGPWTDVRLIEASARFRHAQTGAVAVTHRARRAPYEEWYIFPPDDSGQWERIANRDGVVTPVSARYLRFRFPSNWPDRYVRLPEVEVYGRATNDACTQTCLKRLACVGERGSVTAPLNSFLPACAAYCASHTVRTSCVSCTEQAACPALLPAAFGGQGTCDRDCGAPD